eukprot:TRINITY_DN9916_c0_g1_i2.p1 TRINITY_DN9916_c0_g1~~TRINITY_DN9916_c0_g1_i2.p1  ORF type:complete len:203 (-),score=20.78 TRINITY_DN9916_c0_g1_i2:46-654(-)
MVSAWLGNFVIERCFRENYSLKENSVLREKEWLQFVQKLPIGVLIHNGQTTKYVNDFGSHLLENLGMKTTEFTHFKIPVGAFTEIKGQKIECQEIAFNFESQPANGKIFRDMTQALSYEEEKLKLKYKNILLKSITHELRTPLNSIIPAFDMLEPEVSTVKHQIWEKGKKSSYILLHTIQLIQDLATLETSGFPSQVMLFSN